MPVYQRYFHSELPSGSRVFCIWGMCFYPIGTYWNFGEYHRITLTLTSSSGPIDNMSMFAWTGTLPGVTRVTTENFLDLGSTPTPGTHATADFPTGTDGFSIEIKAGDSAYPLDVRLDFDLAPGDVGYCQYGTQLAPGQGPVAVISAAAVAAAAVLVPELELLAVGFGALVGVSLQTGVLCNGPPPVMPLFGPEDYIFGTQIWSPGSIGKRLQAFEAVMWPSYCVCLPSPGGGAPDPILYPPATIGDQPSIPPAVGPLLCDNTDICQTLNGLSLQLTSISGEIAALRHDVQLIQRQEVPFGYVLGTLHSGLTGAGEFAVLDILGLSIDFTTIPVEYPAKAGDPDTYFGIGKISVGTAQGWERSWQANKDPFLILPVSGAITKVGYAFPPGIAADVTELVREP
jgi:hypothetical protein